MTIWAQKCSYKKVMTSSNLKIMISKHIFLVNIKLMKKINWFSFIHTELCKFQSWVILYSSVPNKRPPRLAVINDVKDHCCNRALKLDCKTIKINFDFTSDLFLMPILMILQNSENIAYLEIPSSKQKKILIYRPDDLSIFLILCLYTKLTW